MYRQKRKRTPNKTLKIVIKSQENKRGREEKKTYKNKCKAINKLAVKNIHIGNYLKCKQIKCPNQKTLWVEGCKIKTRGDFPGGRAVPCSRCKGAGFNPW